MRYWPDNCEGHTYIHTCMYAYIHACMYTCIHTYIHTCIFVVNFHALAQASDIQIERRQVVFLCWKQDLNPGSQTPNRQQTECSLTNRLSYRGSSWKTWTRLPVPMISEHSAHLTPLSVDFRPGSYTHTYIHTTYIQIHTTYIHTYMFAAVNFDALAQARDFESTGDKFSSSAQCRIRAQGLRHQIAGRLNARWQTDWAIEDQAEKITWTRQPVPMISEHSAHSTLLPVGFRTWLWWYTCL